MEYQTDSLGSRSDNSGKTTVTNWCRPNLDVACVIDLPKSHSHHHSEREKVGIHTVFCTSV